MINFFGNTTVLSKKPTHEVLENMTRQDDVHEETSNR
jgi:hypothetical protein